MLYKTLKCTNCNNLGPLSFSDSKLTCSGCGAVFPREGNAFRFVRQEFKHTEDSLFQDQQMHNSSLAAKIFNFGKKIINSEFLPVDHVGDFVRGTQEDKVTDELGSGNRRLSKNIFNVDLFAFPNVDATMDIQNTAFRDASIDVVILDMVLEHVAKPFNVIDEIYRILKPGGTIICTAPWIFPYHGYPKNYFNISFDGHTELFSRFSSIRIEMHHGPTVALTNLISEYLAVGLSFNSRTLYSALKGFFLLPIFWLKYLDFIWSRKQNALRLASSICVTAVK